MKYNIINKRLKKVFIFLLLLLYLFVSLQISVVSNDNTDSIDSTNSGWCVYTSMCVYTQKQLCPGEFHPDASGFNKPPQCKDGCCCYKQNDNQKSKITKSIECGFLNGVFNSEITDADKCAENCNLQPVQQMLNLETCSEGFSCCKSDEVCQGNAKITTDCDECCQGTCIKLQEKTETDCNDHIDNDNDGLIDSQDPDCNLKCFDGIDNEGLNEPNGCLDLKDAACGGVEDCETPGDDDCDGLDDSEDPDCQNACIKQGFVCCDECNNEKTELSSSCGNNKKCCDFCKSDESYGECPYQCQSENQCDQTIETKNGVCCVHPCSNDFLISGECTANGIKLTWQNPFISKCNSLIYSILKDGQIIGSTTQQSYELQFSDYETSHSYSVKAICDGYSKESNSLNVNSGYKMCQGHIGESFCVGLSNTEQGQNTNDDFNGYQNYGELEDNGDSSVTDSGDTNTISHNGNQVGVCTQKKTQTGLFCNYLQITKDCDSLDKECHEFHNNGKTTADCANQPECEDLGEPFGEFYLRSTCENYVPKGSNPNFKYCYMDLKNTIVHACLSCLNIDSCSKYKTKEACEKDNCGIGNCHWQTTNPSLGVGVCLGNGEFDSTICDNPFINCDPSWQTQSVDCNNITSCSDYHDASSCGNTTRNNNCEFSVVTNSNDKCGLGYCSWINGECVKDANADGIPDDISDNTPPETTVSFTNLNQGNNENTNEYTNENTEGNIDEQNNQDIVKVGVNSNIFAEFSINEDGNTFYCIDQSNTCCPSKSQPRITLPTSEMTKTGLYFLRYYSEDLAGNVEQIKTQIIDYNADKPDIKIDYRVGKSKETSDVFITIKSNKLVKCQDSFDNQDSQLDSTQYNTLFYATYSGLDEGSYEYDVKCVDSYGNSIEKTIVIDVDVLKEITNVKPQTLDPLKEVVISFDYKPNKKCILQQRHSNFKFELTSSNEHYSKRLNLNSLDSGTYFFDISCEDSSDKATAYFTLDKSPPNLYFKIKYKDYLKAFTQNKLYPKTANLKVYCIDRSPKIASGHNFGCKSINYCIGENCDNPTECNNDCEIQFSNLVSKVNDDKSIKLCFNAFDNGNNKNETCINFKITDKQGVLFKYYVLNNSIISNSLFNFKSSIDSTDFLDTIQLKITSGSKTKIIPVLDKDHNINPYQADEPFVYRFIINKNLELFEDLDSKDNYIRNRITTYVVSDFGTYQSLFVVNVTKPSCDFLVYGDDDKDYKTILNEITFGKYNVILKCNRKINDINLNLKNNLIQIPLKWDCNGFKCNSSFEIKGDKYYNKKMIFNVEGDVKYLSDLKEKRIYKFIPSYIKLNTIMSSKPVLLFKHKDNTDTYYSETNDFYLNGRVYDDAPEGKRIKYIFYKNEITNSDVKIGYAQISLEKPIKESNALINHYRRSDECNHLGDSCILLEYYDDYSNDFNENQFIEFENYLTENGSLYKITKVESDNNNIYVKITLDKPLHFDISKLSNKPKIKIYKTELPYGFFKIHFNYNYPKYKLLLYEVPNSKDNRVSEISYYSVLNINYPPKIEIFNTKDKYGAGNYEFKAKITHLDISKRYLPDSNIILKVYKLQNENGKEKQIEYLSILCNSRMCNRVSDGIYFNYNVKLNKGKYRFVLNATDINKKTGTKEIEVKVDQNININSIILNHGNKLGDSFYTKNLTNYFIVNVSTLAKENTKLQSYYSNINNKNKKQDCNIIKEKQFNDKILLIYNCSVVIDENKITKNYLKTSIKFSLDYSKDNYKENQIATYNLIFDNETPKIIDHYPKDSQRLYSLDHVLFKFNDRTPIQDSFIRVYNCSSDYSRCNLKDTISDSECNSDYCSINSNYALYEFGNYSFVYYAKDSANNELNKTIKFSLDKSSLGLHITQPLNQNTFTNKKKITISGYIDSFNPKTMKLFLNLDNHKSELYVNSYNNNFEKILNLEEGDHKFNIELYLTKDNKEKLIGNSGTYKIVVDLTPPKAVIIK